MSNSYFAWGDLARFTRAQSVTINDLGDAVEAAFDQLPTADAMRNGTINYSLSTGSEGDYTVLPSPGLTALIEGARVQFRANHTNPGTCRLRANDFAFVTLRDSLGNPLTAGSIVANAIYEARFVGGVWRLTNFLAAPTPTVAPITVGSNANGTFYQFAGGLLICRHLVSATIAISTSVTTGGFVSDQVAWTFPYPFFATPTVTGVTNGLGSGSSVTLSVTTTTAAQIRFTSVTSSASASRVARLIAIGEWM